MASSFPDGNQYLPLLYRAIEGPWSPIQSPSLTKSPVRHTPEVFSPTSVSSSDSRSSTENDLSHWDAPSPPTDTGRSNPPGPGGPVAYPYKERRIGPAHESVNAIGYSEANGLFHRKKDSVEMEIDDLLEVVMDYHSKKRVTMTSVPLLPLPEEDSSDGPADSKPLVNPPLPPLLAATMPYNGDPDTLSLTLSSPRSSSRSRFSSASPSLKSKRSFTPLTPSTDGWRSPPTPTTFLEREATSSDRFEYVMVADSPPEPPHAPGDSYPGSPSEDRRAHHTQLPPLVITISQDATISRRAQNSISSEQTITHHHSYGVDPPTVDPTSSSFSDDDEDGDLSEIAQAGYFDPNFAIAYLSTSGAVSPLFTRPRPRIEIPHGAGLGSLNSGRSPTLSAGTSPGPVEYLSPSKRLHTPSPRRGVFRSLFPQNGKAAPEQKKEGKRAAARNQIQTRSLAARSMDSVLFGTTSTKSSKGKDKDEKNAEKAAKRAQLAVQLKTKELHRATEGDPEAALRAIRAQKGLAAWEEAGAMYSLDGIL